MPLFDHFGLLAPIYVRFFPPPDPSDWRRVLHRPADGALLAAGGGTGRVTAQFSAQATQIVIADVSHGMLVQALKQNDVQVVQAPAEQLPFPDGAFARVIVVDALHHMADAKLALTELVRVLAPGGRLVIQEPDWQRPLMRLVAWAEKLALMRSHPYLSEDMLQMAAQAGGRAHCVRADTNTIWVIVDKPVTGAG